MKNAESFGTGPLDVVSVWAEREVDVSMAFFTIVVSGVFGEAVFALGSLLLQAAKKIKEHKSQVPMERETFRMSFEIG